MYFIFYLTLQHYNENELTKDTVRKIDDNDKQ